MIIKIRAQQIFTYRPEKLYWSKGKLAKSTVLTRSLLISQNHATFRTAEESDCQTKGLQATRVITSLIFHTLTLLVYGNKTLHLNIP